MKHVIFITGGVKSGKSSFAKDLAQKTGKNICFLATCEPKDKEMLKRVKLHQRSRPKHWKTAQVPLNPGLFIQTLDNKIDLVIIDCITLLISNLLLSGKTENKILSEIKNTLNLIKKSDISAIIVSNEVGQGIVPENKLARAFRDISGKVNQLIAKESDQVFVTISGIPVKIK